MWRRVWASGTSSLGDRRSRRGPVDDPRIETPAPPFAISCVAFGEGGEWQASRCRSFGSSRSHSAGTQTFGEAANRVM